MVQLRSLALCLGAVGCAAPGAPLAPAATAPPDGPIQHAVGEELDRTVAEWGASRAVAVVLDLSTGRVLAMDGRSLGRTDSALASNHAWVTGSTLKTITVAAALEERTITLGQRF